jgi:hypothetical protein
MDRNVLLSCNEFDGEHFVCVEGKSAGRFFLILPRASATAVANDFVFLDHNNMISKFR